MRGGAPQPGLSLVCRLGLDGEVPDHSTFSENRHGRFREIDLLRRLFETVVRRCIGEGLVGGFEQGHPKFISPADPAARWTGAHGGQAYIAYSPRARRATRPGRPRRSASGKGRLATGQFGPEQCPDYRSGNPTFNTEKQATEMKEKLELPIGCGK